MKYMLSRQNKNSNSSFQHNPNIPQIVNAHRHFMDVLIVFFLSVTIASLGTYL